MSAQVATTSVEQIGSGGIYTTAVTIEAPAPGFLCVKVVTDRLLLVQKGLKVKFYPSDSSGNIKGDQIGEDATTDDNGVAGVDKRMAPGYFACVVDGITARVRPIDVQTYAEALDKPYLLGLPRGFLSVRLMFRDLRLKDFKVKFFEAGTDGAKKGSALGKPEDAGGVLTRPNGVAALVGSEFKLGNYLCEVDGKWVASVSTVEDAARPYVVALPLVRPFLALQEPGRLEEPVVVQERDASSGYLAVRVLFRDVPFRGASVVFYPSGDGGKAAVDEPKGVAITDSEGVAVLGPRAKLGNYFCQVDGQPGVASISTVEDPSRPYVVSLPVVRPLIAHRAPGDFQVSATAEQPEPSSAYLAVEVLFRGAPIVGTKVTFFACGLGGKPSPEEKGDAITDMDGIATLPAKAKLGNYFCLVAGQPGYASVSTVEDPKQPYVLLLPVGRPLLTVAEQGRIEDPVPVAERPAAAGAYLSVMVLFRGAPARGLRSSSSPALPRGRPTSPSQEGRRSPTVLGSPPSRLRPKWGTISARSRARRGTPR